MRLKRALNEYVIEGVQTNIPFLKKIINKSEFQKADFDVNWVNNIKD